MDPYLSPQLGGLGGDGMGPVLGNPNMLAQAIAARRQPRPQLSGPATGAELAQNLGMVPGLGLLGVGGDISQYIDKPETRGWLPYALTAAGAIPFLGALAKMAGPLPRGIMRSQAGAVGAGGKAVDTNMQLSEDAIKHYGKTYSPSEAGYMAPTGEMLDLSGRHYATGYSGGRPLPGQPDYLKGSRGVDHRELPDSVYAAFPNQSNTERMRSFMNDSNMLRLQPGVGFETTFVPTDFQLMQIERMWGRSRTPLAIDVAHPKTGDTIASVEMANPTADKVRKFVSGVLKNYQP